MLPTPCAYAHPSLTRAGGCHMVLRKDKVEIANPGLTKRISDLEVADAVGPYDVYVGR